MPHPTVALSDADILERLSRLPGWQLRGNALERVYQGKTYLDALDKLVAIARLSEAADHHPDLNLAWKTLTARYWTHTAQGVTTLDFELAESAEAALKSA
jgi:4a-hydroxytetrahydrobiopterin dehydratase